MTRSILSGPLALGILALTSAASIASPFSERDRSMRATVRPGNHAWSLSRPCARPATTCPADTAHPAPTTQITVINVNAPVNGDVVIVNGSCRKPSPLVIGSERTIAGRATVQPVVTSSGRVVVRRW